MIDHERREQHDQPANREEGKQRRMECRSGDVPYDGRERLPFPEDKNQQQARDQHIRAPLERAWNDTSPDRLESGTCHDAVLHGKQPEEHEVDGERIR
jgi:hypothetical protein